MGEYEAMIDDAMMVSTYLSWCHDKCFVTSIPGDFEEWLDGKYTRFDEYFEGI